MKALLLLAAASVLASGPIAAACSYPKAPEKLPDGSTATREEMIGGQQAVKQYDRDINAYLACLKLESEAALAKDADKLTPEQKAELQQLGIQKHNAAVAELEAIAARFNEQIKIFKARKAAG
jgi:hypothetical protein